MSRYLHNLLKTLLSSWIALTLWVLLAACMMNVVSEAGVWIKMMCRHAACAGFTDCQHAIRFTNATCVRSDMSDHTGQKNAKSERLSWTNNLHGISVHAHHRLHYHHCPHQYQFRSDNPYSSMSIKKLWSRGSSLVLCLNSIQIRLLYSTSRSLLDSPTYGSCLFTSCIVCCVSHMVAYIVACRPIDSPCNLLVPSAWQRP